MNLRISSEDAKEENDHESGHTNQGNLLQKSQDLTAIDSLARGKKKKRHGRKMKTRLMKQKSLHTGHLESH